MVRFPKSCRLLKRYEFERILRQGKRRNGKWMTVEYRTLPHLPTGKVKLGITVTKKYGKAHDRNRFKRLVREAYRLIPIGDASACELVVRPRGQVVNQEKRLVREDILNDLMEVLTNYGVFKLTGETQPGTA